MSVMPCCFSDDTSAMPMPVPITMPMIAPKFANVAAFRTDDRPDLAPLHADRRSRPISRVRSNTESMSVFTIPISAMSTARPSRA